MKSSCSGVHPLPLILSSFRFLMPKYESVFPPPGVTVGSDPLIRPPVCLVTLSCSGVQSSLSWSRQLVFFVIAGNRQKKKRHSSVWPLASDPKLPVLSLLLRLRTPQQGECVCSGQGVGLSRHHQWASEDSFHPRPVFASDLFFLAHSYVLLLAVQPRPRLQSASPGGQSRTFTADGQQANFSWRNFRSHLLITWNLWYRFVQHYCLPSYSSDISLTVYSHIRANLTMLC